MLFLIPLTLGSLAICFVLTPFFRDFFGFLGHMDRPDQTRKLHGRATPRVGGVALAISYGFALLALYIGWHIGLIDSRDPSLRLAAKLAPAILVIFSTGLVDDLKGLSPWAKIGGQCAAAAYAVAIGVHLAPPPGYHGPTIVTDLISVFWLILCANAFNLIDGLDGLATGVGLIASASLLMAAVIHHKPGLALAITPLIGALIGFLYYNFVPASIFLGDCGSLLIGFLLGCYGLMWNQHATTGLGRLAPLVAVAFPLTEVMVSIFRRVLRAQPIFSADRNHIHHRIQRLGMSQRKAALVLYAVSGLAALMAVLQTILRPQPASVLLFLLVTVAYMGFRYLRYPEFGILGQFLFAGEFRKSIRIRILLREYEESLAAAQNVEDCWSVLQRTCRETDFAYVSLRVGTHRFEARFKPQADSLPRLQVALSHFQLASFAHLPHVPGPAMLIAPLVEPLQEKLLTFAETSRARSAAAPEDTAFEKRVLA